MGLYRALRITGIKAETDDCKTFYLQPVDHEPLFYQAGQFLTLVFYKPSGEQRRSYSISSTPILGEPLSITVKRLENGEYSRKLFDLANVDDILMTTGAAGFFVLPENLNNYEQIFLTAAGGGITPVLPIIKTLLYGDQQINVVLVYSNRSSKSTIFQKTLLQLADAFTDRFVIEWLYSSALNLERARLSKALLSQFILEHSKAAVDKTLFYTCGPFDYMRMVTIALLEDRVPLQQIRKEHFSQLEVITRSIPPDTRPHSVTIQFRDSSYQLRTQYPQTILQAAKKAGLTLPYSCESGRCGSCTAICVQGKVWMSYNEVLMDDEIERGRVLTCTGYPVNGDVILRYQEGKL